MKWEKRQDGSSLPTYHLTKESSPDWWGILKSKDAKWQFSCGLRGDSSMIVRDSKSYKSISTAKLKAKSFLQITINIYEANRIFIGDDK